MGLTPYFRDDHLTVYQGDCREVMAAMEPESVHCVVTSPPYWGLRDYGIGEKGIGLEPTPEAFVANMVDVFREVRRVLRKDGTLWLNLGDSYANPPPSGTAGQWNVKKDTGRGHTTEAIEGQRLIGGTLKASGLKQKDLCGIPWRVAFALQADGWYLRSDVIWAKPNPMPESVTDRPTKAHEYLFLLTKSARYYYDAVAVREAAEYGFSVSTGDDWTQGIGSADGAPQRGRRTVTPGDGTGGRNLRSVWTIATEPYPGAHFATFPRKLVEPCVKAGTSERGVCPECGAPWTRDTDITYTDAGNNNASLVRKGGGELDGYTARSYETRKLKNVTTTGWRPSCAHDAEPVAATVLDPFGGSGTTGMVAQALGRRAVLIDLNGEYVVQAMARNAQTPLGLVG